MITRAMMYARLVGRPSFTGRRCAARSVVRFRARSTCAEVGSSRLTGCAFSAQGVREGAIMFGAASGIALCPLLHRGMAHPSPFVEGAIGKEPRVGLAAGFDEVAAPEFATCPAWVGNADERGLGRNATTAIARSRASLHQHY